MSFLQQLKEGEDQAEHEERKLNKRAHNMLQIINNRLQTSSDVSFKVKYNFVILELIGQPYSVKMYKINVTIILKGDVQ